MNYELLPITKLSEYKSKNKFTSVQVEKWVDFLKDLLMYGKDRFNLNVLLVKK